MIAAEIPNKFPIPWGNSAGAEYINTVPVASQISITPGAASLTDGFVPLNFTPRTAGGVFPFGKDFNGILNQITAIQQWQSAGGVFKYDSDFATEIGGYPAGAILMDADNDALWLNLADNNTTDPGGATPVNWGVLASYGIAAITGLTNANITLTPEQYNKPIITLAGTLTGNINVILPSIVKEWVIINNTTGAYSITVKTSGGSGVTVAQSVSTPIYGDGTNIGDSVGDVGAHGQCRLSVASTTSLTLAPYNGNNLIIGGVRRKFATAAGVSISNAGLSANTIYYVYATWSGSAIALALSTTGHAMLDSGVEVKSTDADSTLVGMIRTNASSQFVDSITQRFCINWFNRKTLSGNQGFASNRTTASTGLVEISSIERLEFLSWAFDVVYLTSPVNISQNNTGSFASSLYVDGGALSNPVVTPPASGAIVFLCPQYPYGSGSDGYHYASVYGAAATGFTATWLLSTTVLTAQIRG